ncbi:MAG TPA: hypothetical protein VFX92_09055 [Candidatus Krumholzibacteria bacterium]|nr:hypothetical protein [Candidatus Krumholzibacteria bacterium]
MIRKVMAVLSMLNLVWVPMGCETVDAPLESDDYVGLSNPAFALDVENPGELHNRIGRAYISRHAVGETPISRRDFVRNMVEASNEVLREEGLPLVVNATDINCVVDVIRELRREGIFDMFGEHPGDPEAIIAYWREKGVISAGLAAAAHERLQTPEVAGIPSTTMDGHDAKSLQAFDSVYNASRELWAQYGRHAAPIRALAAASEMDPGRVALEVDAAGTLFGLILGGSLGGTIVGIVFSVAFYEVPPGNDPGWDCSDYCNMG